MTDEALDVALIPAAPSEAGPPLIPLRFDSIDDSQADAANVINPVPSPTSTEPPPIVAPPAPPVVEAIEEFHFHDATTGIFTGASFTGTASEAAAQLTHKGDGHGMHRGRVDYLSQRKHVESGDVVDYKPPPPWNGTDLTLNVWVWDKSQKRWVARPRVSKLRADRWSELKAERARRTSSTMVVDGIAWDADESALQTLALHAIRHGDDNWTTLWTDASNVVQTLTQKQALAIWDAFVDRKLSLHAESQLQRTAIAKTPQDAINQVGWEAPSQETAADELRARNRAIVAANNHIDADAQ